MRELTKEILIDAIIGRGIISYKQANWFEKLDIVTFNGNQWNESWAFKREELEKIDIEELMTIYKYEERQKSKMST
jgi:hypothetical protein